ncbi:MAG: alpha-amylase family glycosyl hydrolase, partial [Candidatus Limnocylindria bacterium]
ALLIGESYIPVERIARYLGDHAGDAFDLVFDFDFLFAGWDAPRLRASIESAEALLPEHGWPCRVLSSHDVERHATRFGADTIRAAAALLLTTRGTPVLYMGEEIGMLDVTPPDAARLDRSGRDSSRSPMHWDATTHGGFTSATPWLACGDTVACNAADQLRDPDSTLALYRRLIRLRQESDAIGIGEQRSIDLPADSPAIAFVRRSGSEAALVAINCGPAELELDVAGAARGHLPAGGQLALSTVPGRETGERVAFEAIALAPHEGLVVRLEPW